MYSQCIKMPFNVIRYFALCSYRKCNRLPTKIYVKYLLNHNKNVSADTAPTYIQKDTTEHTLFTYFSMFSMSVATSQQS